jgi:hypothetical protein
MPFGEIGSQTMIFINFKAKRTTSLGQRKKQVKHYHRTFGEWQEMKPELLKTVV